MSNSDIYKKWTEFMNNPKYIDYFKTKEETWFETFKLLKIFIDSNKYKPQKVKDDFERKLHNWLSDQQSNYKNNKASMKNTEVYNTWSNFIKNSIYSNYFKTNKEIWLDYLNKLKQFINNSFEFSILTGRILFTI